MIALDIDRMVAGLEYFPHDFIRDEGFLERARRAYAEDLLRERPEEDDLRFADKELNCVIAERLPWDSSFFGYGVARLHGIFPLQSRTSDLNEVMMLLRIVLRQRKIRYLFTVVPAENTELIGELSFTNWRLIETRVTYWRTLSDYAHPERYPVRLATAEDALPLAELSSQVVNPYDRFHADPWLDPKAVDRLFRVWPLTSINQKFADAVLVPDVPGEAQAWVSIKYHADMWERWGYKLARPGNGAVDPSMKGWYTKLISEVCYHLKDRGVDAIYIPTQATNRAVIAAWHKLGFKYGKTEHVFRVVL